MNLQNAQIYHWIQTGEHRVQTDYAKAASYGIKTGSSDTGQSFIGNSYDDDVSIISTASPHMPDELLGADDDVLIPKPADIDRVFQAGRQTWMRHFQLAKLLPRNSLPAELGSPSIMLKDIPALPESLPQGGILVGQPLWHVPSTEQKGKDAAGSNDWDLEHVHGARKHFCLSYATPIECRSSSQSGSPHFGSSSYPDDGHWTSAAPEGLLLLTLCWSYILSVRFWELQGKTLCYSPHVLSPKATNPLCARQGDINLHLGEFASHDLVKWLCAVLAPSPGWFVKGGGGGGGGGGGLGFTPWSAVCSGDVRFIVSTDKLVTFASKEQAPHSTRAAELLIELCSLYGLGPSKRENGSSEPLSPPTAAFLAALALPFYRHVGLPPQFPMPTSLKKRSINGALLEPIRQYVTDLRYYMTLSMHPRSLGSAIWSIFWQPEIECNLVSPWLSAILDVLKPIINAGSLDMMAKVFALRRPRVALWWLGIFLLGNHAVLDLIARYLETLEERWGHGSLAPPDTSVSTWTGSPQSFLDKKTSRVYPCLADLVPMADLLRHRYNFRLQDVSSPLLSWRPFGSVSKDVVEPELWPWLERGYLREYKHWVWWVKRGGQQQLVPDIQHGFRKDTGRFVPAVPDRLEITRVLQAAEHTDDDDIKLEPSQQSTLQMLVYCMEDASRDRDPGISIVPGARGHAWLKYWRGPE